MLFISVCEGCGKSCDWVEHKHLTNHFDDPLCSDCLKKALREIWEEKNMWAGAQAELLAIMNL